MLLDRLYKGVARVVLVCYTTTHLLAPLAHACEVLTKPPIDHFAKQRLASLSDPLLKSKVISSPIPKIPSVDPLKASLQAQTYQYHLGVKTLSSQKTRFELNLSRKEKTSKGPFEQLHTATIRNGRLNSSSSIEDDALLNLFRGASVHHFTKEADTICFAWSVSDFGTLKIARDGSVFFDQGAAPILFAYDLVMKTSNDLFLQNLGVSELTLESPTHIMGTVATNRLHMHHDVVNEGGLQAKEIYGQGKLTNHAVLKLEGTSDQPAILSVPQLINKKGNSVSKEATIEAPYLHITSGNQFVSNGEGAEFRVANSLLVDPAEHGSFINKGSLHLGDAVLNRRATNAGFWQAHQMTVNGHPFVNKSFGTLNILDTLTITSELMNEGDITAKNLLKLEKGVNKGTLKGESLFLETSQSFKNEGDMFLKALTGTGTFYNDKSLKFSAPSGRHGSIDVANFRNGGNAKSKSRAKIAGEHICIADGNQAFTNDADIFVGRLNIATQCSKTLETRFINSGHIESQTVEVDSSSYKYIWENAGTIKTTRTQLAGRQLNFINMLTGSLTTSALTSTASNLDNQGTIKVKDTMSVSEFTNSQGSTLKTDSLVLHKDGKFTNALKSIVTLKKAVKADDALLQNDGEMVTRGKFVQQTGEFINTGLWDHQGDIDLGSTKLRNNKGTLIWQDGTWTFSPQEYINNGKWFLGQMECSQPLTIHNYITLHLQNSRLAFAFLINHGNLIFSGGQYTVKDEFQSKGLISFLEHDWTFTDDSASTASHRLVLDGIYAKKCTPTGEVECKKSLTYDLQILPKAIRSEGDVIFSKRHLRVCQLDQYVRIGGETVIMFHLSVI